MRGERAVPKRVRWSEEGDDWSADGRGKVHRSGVAGDEQIQAGQERGERRQVERPRDVDRRQTGQPLTHRIDERPIGRRAREDDRRVFRLRQAAGDAGEAIEMPLLRFPAAAGVYADEWPVMSPEQLLGGSCRFSRSSGVAEA